MSGINIELRNTWRFMVSELLSPFNDPRTGYIAINGGALNYSEQKKIIKPEIVADQEDELQVESEKSDNNPGWFSYFWSASEEKKLESAQASSSYASAWSNLSWAVRYKAGDTVELTASKVLALTDLVRQVEEDMTVPLTIQKLFFNEQEDSQKSESSTDLIAKAKVSKDVKSPKEIKDIKEIEMEQLQNRIGLLRRYGAEAESKILNSIDRVNSERQAQGKAAKAPATADAYLHIWKNMWEWAESEISLLHTCLAFEAATPVESKGPLWDNRDLLEAKFVTYLFRTMCMIQLDSFSNDQAAHTGYTRQLNKPEADKLVKKLQETIKTLNNNMLVYPGLRRINQLINIIDSVQLTVHTAFNNSESIRYSILSDYATNFLPSKTPGIIASKPNQFLIKMRDILRGFNVEANNLKTSIDIHIVDKDTQQARARLTNTSM